jgi:hypothetical protein
VEPLAEEDPRQVGEFRLERLLGQGGMGRVYLGRSMISGRPVAVKVIRPKFAADPDFMTRFRREVEAVSVVSGAFTAPPVAAGPDDIPPWVATEYIPGPSLRKLVGTAGPLPEAAVWNLAGSLVEALGEIHRRGLVHRDLKPENILIATDGPRVIDFGISRDMARTAVTDPREVLGTLLYMSPEQLGSSRVSQASDVFSLGSVIAFAGTGREPFAAAGEAAIVYRIAHGDPDLDGLPPGLRRLVAACLLKDPVLRPSLDQLSSAIKSGRASFPEAAAGKYWPGPVAAVVEHMVAQTGMAEPAAPGPVPPSPGTAAVTRAPAGTMARQQTSPAAGPRHSTAPVTGPVGGRGAPGRPRQPEVTPGQRRRTTHLRWRVAALWLGLIAVAVTVLILQYLPSTASVSTTGDWSHQNGKLKLAISRVDLQGGVLHLHMKAINDSAAEMNLPLYGNFVATDNSGVTYTADAFGSDWSGTVPSGGFITGIVNLVGTPSASAKTLKVSFTDIYGQYAPGGGITVDGVPVPR